MFYKYFRVFCRQLLKNRVFQISCFAIYIIFAFADNHSVIIKSQNNLMYRYTLQQSIMIVFYPLIIMPICLHDEFVELHQQLLTLYTRRVREIGYALWAVFTMFNAIPFVLGVGFNFLLQAQYVDVSIRITACYMFIGVSEIAVAYGVYIMLFSLFRRSFKTMVSYFLIMFIGWILSAVLKIPAIGFPLTANGIDLLYTNASLVVLSRGAYLLILLVPPALLFIHDRVKRQES